jgi:F-type H+-transporting ATPase subunit a
VFWDAPHLISSLFTPHPLADAGGPLWLLPKIEVGPNELFRIGPFPVTNTLIASWISMIIVIALFVGATRKMTIIPKGLQNFVEWAAGLLQDFCNDVAGEKWGRTFFPFIATIFFFVLFANWASIIPGIESLGTPEPGTHPVLGIFLVGNDSNKLVPWFRPASTDLNFTLALAIISVVVTQVYGFRTLGFGQHMGKYLTFRDPISFIVGILEIVAEFARIISFSFRLFGNVFAGDVLLLVLGTLVPFIGPTVFYPLELFVGFIQAFVFAALTLVFLSLAVTGHDEEHAAAH